MILLITWLWQGIAVACATATVLARARALDAATRHAVWWAATAAVVSLPAVHALAALDAEPIPSDAALPVPPAPDWVLQTMLLAWLVFAAAGLLRSTRRNCDYCQPAAQGGKHLEERASFELEVIRRAFAQLVTLDLMLGRLAVTPCPSRRRHRAPPALSDGRIRRAARRTACMMRE